eukprot:m.287936 g.287936  ORF g.287936 m.287936 type:complete len:70 (+) comp16368_c0_seq28:2958-3167(+)
MKIQKRKKVTKQKKFIDRNNLKTWIQALSTINITVTSNCENLDFTTLPHQGCNSRTIIKTFPKDFGIYL